MEIKDGKHARKLLLDQGINVKSVRKVNFQDLARGSAFFADIDASPSEYKKAKLISEQISRGSTTKLFIN